MGKGRILVVDDDQDMLTLMVHLLGSEKYEVATVSKSTSAYEKILQFSPDLIILDLVMPGLDGEALLKTIKESELTNNIPVIIISGIDQPERIRRNLEQGAEDFLAKPFHPEVLIGRVEKAMQRIKHMQTIRSVVERYLGQDVASMVVDQPEQVKLTGMRRPIVSLFADIRGFSTIVENMEPEEVVRILNRLFTELSNAVFAMGGTIDKFMGDGIMAFWGAPLPNEDMEVLAVESALLMLEKCKVFNAERRYPGGLEIMLGIGLSLGNAVVGNIGSEKRVDYTVIGESVNVASRLEKLAKPGQILVTETLYDKIKDNFTCREIGEHQLKGKTLPIKLFEIIS